MHDMYGFEVPTKYIPSYSAFYNKFVLQTQNQSTKIGTILESGVLKNWSCIYSKGGNTAAYNIDYFSKVATFVRDGLPLYCRGEVVQT